MGQRHVAGAIIFAAWLLMPACNRGQPTPNELLEHMNMDDGQQAHALNAINVLREEFNAGACQRIYDDAPGYFWAEKSEDWMQDCQRLKNELGLWIGFKVESARRCGKTEFVVCLYGSAEFDKQTTEVSIRLLLRADGAQLLALAIRDGDHHWTQVPHGSRPIPGPWIDPPPPKSPKHGLAS